MAGGQPAEQADYAGGTTTKMLELSPTHLMTRGQPAEQADYADTTTLELSLTDLEPSSWMHSARGDGDAERQSPRSHRGPLIRLGGLFEVSSQSRSSHSGARAARHASRPQCSRSRAGLATRTPKQKTRSDLAARQEVAARQELAARHASRSRADLAARTPIDSSRSRSSHSRAKAARHASRPQCSRSRADLATRTPKQELEPSSQLAKSSQGGGRSPCESSSMLEVASRSRSSHSKTISSSRSPARTPRARARMGPARHASRPQCLLRLGSVRGLEPIS
jgi:hypothetical protein